LRRRAFALKHPRNHGSLCAGADDLRRRLVSEEQTEGVDQNRFSRAGFTRQQVQSVTELDHGIVDNRVIFESKLNEHGSDCTEIRRSIAQASEMREKTLAEPNDALK